MFRRALAINPTTAVINYIEQSFYNLNLNFPTHQDMSFRVRKWLNSFQSTMCKKTFGFTRKSWKDYEIIKMKCKNCRKESQWLEIIGSDFVCHKCIGKHKIMGLVLRTHMNTFNFLIRNLKIKDYEGLIGISREEIEKAADLKKHGIILKKEG